MTAAGWVFSILDTLLLLALVIGVVLLAISAIGNRSAGPSDSDAWARGILDRRVAAGELTLDQYHELRGALGDGCAARANERALQSAGAHG